MVLDTLRGLMHGMGGAKAASNLIRFSPTWMKAPAVDVSFPSIVNEGYRKNSAVWACIRTHALAFPEPPMVVRKKTKQGWDNVENHPLTKLMERPNPFMGQGEFWAFTITWMALGGNAYIWKRRSDRGKVVELWPLHDGQIQPRLHPTKWIDGYVADAGDGMLVTVPAEDIIHLRWAPDPKQPQVGMGPIVSVAREVESDNEAARYVHALLHNDAVPRTIVSVKTKLPEDAFQRLRKQFKERYGGDNRGDVLFVEGQELSIDRIGQNMSELADAAMRRVPETRISAAFEVPAILAGLGAGLDSGTYANAAMLAEFYTEKTLIPRWRIVGDQFSAQLLPEFEFAKPGRVGDPALVVAFDLTDVRALAGDETQKWSRLKEALASGGITVNEYRIGIGFEPVKNGDMFLRMPTMTLVDTVTIPPPPPPPGADPSGGMLPPGGGAPGGALPPGPDPADDPWAAYDDLNDFGGDTGPQGAGGPPALGTGGGSDPLALPPGAPTTGGDDLSDLDAYLQELGLTPEEIDAAEAGDDTGATDQADPGADDVPEDPMSDPTSAGHMRILGIHASDVQPAGDEPPNPDETPPEPEAVSDDQLDQWLEDLGTDEAANAYADAAEAPDEPPPDDGTGGGTDDLDAMLASLDDDPTPAEAGVDDFLANMDDGEDTPAPKPSRKASLIPDEQWVADSPGAEHKAPKAPAPSGGRRRGGANPNRDATGHFARRGTGDQTGRGGPKPKPGARPMAPATPSPAPKGKPSAAPTPKGGAAKPRTPKGGGLHRPSVRAMATGAALVAVGTAIGLKAHELRYTPGIHHNNPTATSKAMQGLFGRDLDEAEIKGLANAPSEADVRVASAPNGGLRMMTRSPVHQGFAVRTITKDAEGKIDIHNDLQRLKESEQGKGTGTRLLVGQIAAAQKVGAHTISTVAARGPGFNGYYSWARMGYDAPTPIHIQYLAHATMGEGHPVKNISDLMRHPEGRKVWKQYGYSTHMTFDVQRGSHSRKVLAAYLRERRARGDRTDKKGADTQLHAEVATMSLIPAEQWIAEARPIRRVGAKANTNKKPNGTFGYRGTGDQTGAPNMPKKKKPWKREIDPADDAKAQDILTEGFGISHAGHASYGQRGQAKGEVAQRLAARLEQDPDFAAVVNHFSDIQHQHFGDTPTEKGINTLVHRWTRTSGDSDTMAVGIQHAVMDLFHVEGHAQTWDDHSEAAARALPDPVKAGLKKYVMAQYHETQKELEKRGIKELTLFRGMGFNDYTAPEWTGPKNTAPHPGEVALQPLNATSSDMAQAKSFAQQALGHSGSTNRFVIMGMKVPAEHIITSARTGTGCLTESEFLVAGGKREAIQWDYEYGDHRSAADIGEQYAAAHPAGKLNKPPKPPKIVIPKMPKLAGQTTPTESEMLPHGKAFEEAVGWSGQQAGSSHPAQAMYLYTQHHYTYINGELRNQHYTVPEPNRKFIALMDRAMEAAKAPRDMSVWRGHKDLAGFGDKPPEVGTIVTDPGFHSTSISKSHAEGASHTKDGVLVKMNIPKGYQAAYVKTLSAHPTEEEVLLRRATKYQIVSSVSVDSAGREVGSPGYSGHYRYIVEAVVKPSVRPPVPPHHDTKQVQPPPERVGKPKKKPADD